MFLGTGLTGAGAADDSLGLADGEGVWLLLGVCPEGKHEQSNTAIRIGTQNVFMVVKNLPINMSKNTVNTSTREFCFA